MPQREMWEFPLWGLRPRVLDGREVIDRGGGLRPPFFPPPGTATVHSRREGGSKFGQGFPNLDLAPL